MPLSLSHTIKYTNYQADIGWSRGGEDLLG